VKDIRQNTDKKFTNKNGKGATLSSIITYHFLRKLRRTGLERTPGTGRKKSAMVVLILELQITFAAVTIL